MHTLGAAGAAGGGALGLAGTGSYSSDSLSDGIMPAVAGCPTARARSTQGASSPEALHAANVPAAHLTDLCSSTAAGAENFEQHG